MKQQKLKNEYGTEHIMKQQKLKNEYGTEHMKQQKLKSKRVTSVYSLPWLPHQDGHHIQEGRGLTSMLPVALRRA